jgi:hypothetical protein
MTDELQFMTENSPGQPTFERAVSQITAFLQERFKGTSRSSRSCYGPRMSAVLRMGVARSLADDGRTSAEAVRHTLSEQAPTHDAEVESVIRRLDAIIAASDRQEDGDVS